MSDLLFRLFHEDGVRVYDPKPVHHACRCNTQKIDTFLKTMSDEDIQHMVVDGVITITCEFCSRDFVTDPKTLF